MKRSHLIVLMTASCILSGESAAQGRLSLWIGAGTSVRDSADISLKRSDLSLGLQLDAPLIPLALRAEGMVATSDIFSGPRSWFLSAVLPMRLPAIQPYLVGGYGVYSSGTPLEEKGLNYGAGARLGLGRFGLYAEVRKHEPLRRTMGTIGITL